MMMPEHNETGLCQCSVLVHFLTYFIPHSIYITIFQVTENLMHIGEEHADTSLIVST